MPVYCPADAADAGAMVSAAHDSQQSFTVRGGDSKRAYGRPATTAHVLDLSRLNGIRSYDPAELVLTAAAATPLDVIESTLAANGQMLAFEPPDWGALLNSHGRRPTLGGIVSCNLSGPRRVHAGAARDHVLGFKAVNGRGVPFKAGGAVVKNVTGYDLPKLMAGACGTLGVLTEITVKVLPRPETECSLLVRGLGDAAAIDALSKAMRSPAAVSGAAHLPAPLARRLLGCDRPGTLLRLEGPKLSLEPRCTLLRSALTAADRCDVLDAQTSATLWPRIGAVGFCEQWADSDLVWRICAAPSQAAELIATVARHIAIEWFFDWAGSQTWIRLLDPCDDAGVNAIRSAVARYPGAHATLVRAPAAVRARIDPFHPLAQGLSALTARIKLAFDPRRVLNPARMYVGI